MVTFVLHAYFVAVASWKPFVDVVHALTDYELLLLLETV